MLRNPQLSPKAPLLHPQGTSWRPQVPNDTHKAPHHNPMTPQRQPEGPQCYNQGPPITTTWHLKGNPKAPMPQARPHHETLRLPMTSSRPHPSWAPMTSWSHPYKTPWHLYCTLITPSMHHLTSKEPQDPLASSKAPSQPRSHDAPRHPHDTLMTPQGTRQEKSTSNRQAASSMKPLLLVGRWAIPVGCQLNKSQQRKPQQQLLL